MARGGRTSLSRARSSAPADPARILAWPQPIVALTTGTVTGYEALARFPDDPDNVADVFEAAWVAGVGPQLEASALSVALRLQGRPTTTYLTVNVSPRALSAEVVRAVLDTDLVGIVVELTEAHNVPPDELKRMASWLRDRGARLAIDDVGTGYAGLERLICVGPDLIKLDRSLVTQLPVDQVSRVMVESLVRFAARSGAAIVAEGIETHALLEVVAELDITFGQGFLFGPAAPTWTTPSDEVVAAAVTVHRQALSATPKQAMFLDEVILLERIADRFSEAEELVDVHQAVETLTRLVGAEHVTIDLVDECAATLDALTYVGTGPAGVGIGRSRQLDDHPLVRWVLDTRRAAMILASDPKADAIELERMTAAGFGGLLLVPVITRGTTVGLLSFYRTRSFPWTLAQIRFARIGASQLAATLDRLLPTTNR